jgi:hypothetical protein
MPAVLRRPIVAAVLLLAVYVALSFLMSTAGFLGTDTGGKVATLATMEARDTWTNPDVGYWAASWDDTGRVHGLIYTVRQGDRWVNVTSLPMIIAGEPLWRIGGYRLALLLPMLGAVACAFVARGFERQLRGGEGWWAFWLVGLASPVAIYALDFWEHTIGLALIAAGLLVLLRAVERGPEWWSGAVAGATFGAAFSMRTEAVVYGVVGVAIATVALWRVRSRLGPAILLGASAGAGFAAMFLANSALERAVLGQTFRSGRAVGAASSGGSSSALRLREAAITSVSPFPTGEWTYTILGLLLLAALVVWAQSARARGQQRLAVLSAAVVALLVVHRLSFGLGFWPGLIATTPLAAVGLALGWPSRAGRLVIAFAVAPLPLVFLFQFPGGAIPQWGGRYILTTGLLLASLGAASLPKVLPWARRGLVVVSVAATVAGVAWLGVRSHDIETSGALLDARSEQVLISRNGFPPREFGATYGRKNWLALSVADDLDVAIDVARRSGASTFAIVDLESRPDAVVAGYHVVGHETVAFIEEQQLHVTSYRADGS